MVATPPVAEGTLPSPSSQPSPSRQRLQPEVLNLLIFLENRLHFVFYPDDRFQKFGMNRPPEGGGGFP